MRAAKLYYKSIGDLYRRVLEGFCAITPLFPFVLWKKFVEMSYSKSLLFRHHYFAIIYCFAGKSISARRIGILIVFYCALNIIMTYRIITNTQRYKMHRTFTLFPTVNIIIAFYLHNCIHLIWIFIIDEIL